MLNTPISFLVELNFEIFFLVYTNKPIFFIKIHSEKWNWLRIFGSWLWGKQRQYQQTRAITRVTSAAAAGRIENVWLNPNIPVQAIACSLRTVSKAHWRTDFVLKLQCCHQGAQATTPRVVHWVCKFAFLGLTQQEQAKWIAGAALKTGPKFLVMRRHPTLYYCWRIWHCRPAFQG